MEKGGRAFQEISTNLLVWYERAKRPLPWRKTKDPYKIWISEIMLQQTQVDTVLPYYERWLKSFPGVRRLAAAPLARVLKLWEGLGYYARARNLHKTAKIVTRKFHGKFPAQAAELRKLPGIGRYTAGALASIAFNQPEPILDGNVKRVLSRLFALKEAVDTQAGEKRLWEISRQLVSGAKGSYGDFNQALMELGALVCLPENPRCSACPVKTLCKAHRLKRETEFPVKLRNQKTEELKTVALVAWKNGRVLLEKQPLQSRWGGLWMFPQWILAHGKPPAEFLRKKAGGELGLQVENLRPRFSIEHGFTKYRVHLEVYEGSAVRGGGSDFNPQGKNGTAPFYSWVNPSRLARLPLPAPHQKIARQIQAHA